MLLKDLISQTRSVLPLFTEDFTENISISSITKVSDTVTVVATSHGLSVSDQVLISGVKTEVTITSIIAVDDIATATCSTDHDLTLGYTLNVVVASPESVFAGTFQLLSVPDKFTFTYQFTGVPAGSSTGTLETFHNRGFNGPQTVTAVVDTDTFEYTLVNDSISAGTGSNMLVMKLPRITGAATLDRAIENYTRQNTDVIWGYFILDDAVTSDDRQINNDSKNERQIGEDFKLRLIQDAHFYIFIPDQDRKTGRESMDFAQALAAPLYKALAGFLVPNSFTTSQQTLLMPASHGLEDYQTPFLTYRYTFQTTEFMLREGVNSDVTSFMANSGDMLPRFLTRAFREFEWKITNDFDEVIKDDKFEIPPSKNS